ncbi:hypothetical protein BGP77_16655 [Saccharospirillum sp. MSK14-1]|nr:hypothetical protein BGP77_16655 [Saccharospirillum sp. MSK14-1]
MTADQVIRKIKAGDYAGERIGDQWHIDPKTTTHETPEPQQKYIFAIIIANLISAVGWVALVGGIVALCVSVASYGSGTLAFIKLLVVAVAPSVGAILTGILFIALGQVMRATFDTANYNREVLRLLQQQRTAHPLEC